MAKKPQEEGQKILIAVDFHYGVAEDGARKKVAGLKVEYHPDIPMLDKHKVNYGVGELQAAAARLPLAVEKYLEEKGYELDHPGVNNQEC
jgi:hypothetical protein